MAEGNIFIDLLQNSTADPGQWIKAYKQYDTIDDAKEALIEALNNWAVFTEDIADTIMVMVSLIVAMQDQLRQAGEQVYFER